MRSDIEKSLRELGISATNENGKFKSCGEILEDLSKKWADLYEEHQKVAVKEIVKTNRVKTNAAIFNYNINKHMLKVQVEEGKLMPKYLFKILVKENVIPLNYKYKRISPYKIQFDRDESYNKIYKIIFKDIKSGLTEEKIVVKTAKNGALEKGEYEFFIPDVLEALNIISPNLNSIITYDGEEYQLSRFSEYQVPTRYMFVRDRNEEIENRINIAEEEGFNVPKGYKEYLESVIK